MKMRLTALALLLLICFFHCAASAARTMPAAAVPPLVVVVHHQENGVKVDANDVLVLENATAGSGAEEETEEPACEGNDDECMQRRLLRDAHLDYIYTQHNGKP